MLRLQNIILEMVARGQPLDVTTDRLCREVEAMLPGVLCSVLTVDRAGLLHSLAGPSLPDSYCASIDGVLIGPATGSCGTAAYLGTPVAVIDIETDARWAAFRHLALPLGLRACWSSPICDGQGEVLGTFAFYYHDRRGPSRIEQAIVATCVNLCAIAMERHERVSEREREARCDGLTGLANRACFDQALARLSCDEPGAWALLVADLDNLKVVNDTFGHHVGDHLLKEVGVRLAAAVAPDPVFRLGGDEFALLLQAPEALRDLDATAEGILRALGEPAECDGHLLHPMATIGGAILSHGDRSAEIVRQNADFALYHAKETGRGGFIRYWPGIGTAITHRLSAIQDVTAALNEGRIDAYYQPLVRLDTREIVGVEALCRLITPDGDILPAASFHDATSDAHVASGLTDTMLERVAGDVRRWLDMGIPFRHVGVNVASPDFHRGRLHAQIAAAFGRAGVPLDHLVVEVTEGVYLGQRDHVIAREIQAMREGGLRVALDDFGTGFASLTHLLTMPIDVIKIDKSFVDRLAPGDPGAAVIAGVLSIARDLGIAVVAEGIETESQAALLRDFGCSQGQGFLFSPAVNRDMMTAMLHALAEVPGQRGRNMKGRWRTFTLPGTTRGAPPRVAVAD